MNEENYEKENLLRLFKGGLNEIDFPNRLRVK
jgi:hypothetical protein